MMKQILIPVAAFALTVSAASAFTGSELLKDLDLGLTDTQESALEEAFKIREEAEAEARGVLTAAGIDDETLRDVHLALRKAQRSQHEAMRAAVESNDYAAYVAAVEGMPMAQVIDTEAEFADLVEAHELREDGKFEEARAILDKLDLPRGGSMMGGMGNMKGGMRAGEGDRGF
jgi:hypothetical protein